MPTLEQYHAYHSMVCSPSTAKACGESFTNSGGTVIFMPKTGSSPSQEDYTSDLSVLTYYLLVLVSFTGLSTLLGMTEFVAKEEIDEKESAVSPHLQSVRNSSVVVPIEALRHVADQSNSTLSDFRIVRKFEYDFQLIGLNVIMIHLSSPGIVKDGPMRLHLVEVYEFRNGLLRSVANMIMSFSRFIWPGIGRIIASTGFGNSNVTQKKLE